MTTTFATPAGHAPTTDPTDVMGRRIGAWIIDAILTLVIVGGVLGLIGEYKDVPDNYDDKTEFCEDLLDANRDFKGNCIASPVGDRVYLIEYSDTLIYSGASLVWFVLNFVLLQGMTGGTVGKLITGVRVVDAHGANAGPGRCLGRSVMWIVDGLPGVPLVGGIAALTSNGHRRVGDMVTGSFVVGASSVGRPVNTPAVAAPPGAQAWGAAPQAAQAPQAWQQPTSQPSWEQPAQQQPQPAAAPSWSAPEAPAQDPTQVHGTPSTEPTNEPAPTEPLGIGSEPEAQPEPAQPEPAAAEPEATETPDAQPQEPEPIIEAASEPTAVVPEEPAVDDEPPAFDPTATVAGAHAPWAAAQPPAQAPAEPQPTTSASEPQWDEARGTYIQWDPAANTWVQWDAGSNAWRPIS